MFYSQFSRRRTSLIIHTCARCWPPVSRMSRKRLEALPLCLLPSPLLLQVPFWRAVRHSSQWRSSSNNWVVPLLPHLCQALHVPFRPICNAVLLCLGRTIRQQTILERLSRARNCVSDSSPPTCSRALPNLMLRLQTVKRRRRCRLRLQLSQLILSNGLPFRVSRDAPHRTFRGEANRCCLRTAWRATARAIRVAGRSSSAGRRGRWPSRTCRGSTRATPVIRLSLWPRCRSPTRAHCS